MPSKPRVLTTLMGASSYEWTRVTLTPTMTMRMIKSEEGRDNDDVYSDEDGSYSSYDSYEDDNSS